MAMRDMQSMMLAEFKAERQREKENNDAERLQFKELLKEVMAMM